jgi:hypothetical protein
MYKVATKLIRENWGNTSDMTDALGVLLLTWNQAFYRYGIFDFEELERCLSKHFIAIDSFRKREISTLSEPDESLIRTIFIDFLNALKIEDGKKKGLKSPVSVAKTLHLLAPLFFPIWDDKIARAYGCYYSENPAEQYLKFSRIAKQQVDQLKIEVSDPKKPFLKLLDEYNYSKFTKKWI